ncbi:MAG: orotate phosphoribosyltransferase [Candidatus Norongarragalinales archaeon]
MKSDFLKLLLKKGGLKIAPSASELFKLKSGRYSPFFINIGSLTDGESIHALRKAYSGFTAGLLSEGKIERFDFVYGPAYKGITLAAILAEGLFEKGYDIRTLYDRKEAKDYGDQKADKVIVGSGWFKQGQKILIIDDVITAGGTTLESLEKLKLLGEHKVVGVVLAVDRQERMGDAERVGDLSSTQMIQQSYNLNVYSILTMQEIFEEIKPHIPSDIRQAWVEYYDKYGAVKLR